MPELLGPLVKAASKQELLLADLAAQVETLRLHLPTLVPLEALVLRVLLVTQETQARQAMLAPLETQERRV
jgi:hypothetical protein